VKSTLEKWSARDGWVADAAAFDERVRATGEVIELTVDAVTHANQRKAKITSTIIDDSYQMWLDAKKSGIAIPAEKLPGVLSTVFKDEAMALGAATERHEVAISFADDAAPQIAQLFISVNMIHDPEMRAAQFAEGMNDLARRFVNAQR
jgi:predicted HAD superfamily phosphohydrolase